MASLHISTDRASIEQPEPIPGLSTLADHIPFLTALASLPSMNRPQLRRIADRAIECMDLIDGDPDLESNGDELDGTDAEDEVLHNFGLTGMGGPGCPISDPGEDDGDEDDGTDAEDEQLSRYARTHCKGPGCIISDPDRGIDDDPHDDSGEAEPEEGHIGTYGPDQRIAAVGHGYKPWDIDRNDFADGER